MQHAEIADESVQLKTLQTILIIFQSRLHPESEVNNAYMLVFISLCNVLLKMIRMKFIKQLFFFQVKNKQALEYFATNLMHLLNLCAQT